MAKHRATHNPLNWRKELWWLRNHWYVFVKPRITGKVRSSWIYKKP